MRHYRVLRWIDLSACLPNRIIPVRMLLATIAAYNVGTCMGAKTTARRDRTRRMDRIPLVPSTEKHAEGRRRSVATDKTLTHALHRFPLARRSRASVQRCSPLHAAALPLATPLNSWTDYHERCELSGDYSFMEGDLLFIRSGGYAKAIVFTAQIKPHYDATHASHCAQKPAFLKAVPNP